MEERSKEKLKLSEVRIKEILDLYQPHQIFLTNAEIDPGETRAHGLFIVPSTASHSRIYFPYVTAEQYIRCISQLSYVLLFALQETGGLKIPDATLEKLTLLKNRPAMYYRRFENLHFRKLANKNESFSIDLTFIDARKIREFAIGKFKIEEPHVSGVFEGVVPLDPPGA